MGRIIVALLGFIGFTYIVYTDIYLSFFLYGVLSCSNTNLLSSSFIMDICFRLNSLSSWLGYEYASALEKMRSIVSCILSIYVMYNVCSLFKPIHINTNMFFSIDYDYLLGLLGLINVYTRALLTSIRKKVLEPITNGLIWLAGLFALLAFYKILPDYHQIYKYNCIHHSGSRTPVKEVKPEKDLVILIILQRSNSKITV